MRLKRTTFTATNLYLDICKQYARTGNALTIRDVRILLDFESTATPRYYLSILEKWGLIKRSHAARTIVPIAPEGYPPVEYRRMKNQS